MIRWCRGRKKREPIRTLKVNIWKHPTEGTQVKTCGRNLHQRLKRIKIQNYMFCTKGQLLIFMKIEEPQESATDGRTRWNSEEMTAEQLRCACKFGHQGVQVTSPMHLISNSKFGTFALSLIDPLPRIDILAPVSSCSLFKEFPLGPSNFPTKLN